MLRRLRAGAFALEVKPGLRALWMSPNGDLGDVLLEDGWSLMRMLAGALEFADEDASETPRALMILHTLSQLDAALERGNLRQAIALAEDVRVERGRAIDLETAARFLPLIARESPPEFDAWALRWLARWFAEAPAPTIEQAAEVAASLADLPSEPVGPLDLLGGALGTPARNAL